ncbi:MAG: sensor histidine kinase [Myxococcota bacterium]
MELQRVRAEAQQSALADQSARASRLVLRVRLVALGLFTPILAVLHFAGGPGWDTYVLPTAIYGALALALFLGRRAPRLTRLAPYFGLLDVLLVFELQRRSMPTSPFPAGVAGFSLGLFGMLVVLTASTMRRTATWSVSALAAVTQVTLMALAGVSVGAQVAAVVVLIVVALTQGGVNSRVQHMVRNLANREVDWRLEHEQVRALTEARGTIERLLAEAEARNERLISLQTDKDALTALLVHDLRAPLGAVRANLDWLRKELPTDLDPDLVDALVESRQTTDRLAAMIGDLLNVNRLESGQLELQRTPTSSRALLGGVQKLVQAQGRARNITVDYQVDDVLLDVDVGLVTRVLENLTSNALRYTPAGARIGLAASRAGDDVLLAVRNDGTPIPPAARPRLFEKFVQGGTAQENRRAGWGLGLYFCRLCVEAHGGTIAVEDAPGWATSFVIRLRAASAGALAA